MPRQRVCPVLHRRAPSGTAPLSAALASALLCLAAPIAGCAGAAPQEAERYPEKKRPEPLRSASDGEVMGANQQSPEDTLEGSMTTGHAAPKGPGAEAEEAHQRLEYEECEAENRKVEANVDGAGATPKKKRVCPPAPAAPDPE